MEDPITRTCNILLLASAAVAVLAVPAAAKPATPKIDPVATFVQARAAEIAGNDGKAAGLMVTLADAYPSDQTMVRRAIAVSVQAGRMDEAARLAKTLPLNLQAFDSRLLLVADALRKGRNNEAVAIIEKGTTSTETELFAPIVKAWAETAKGSRAGIEALAKLPPSSPVASIADDHRALMLLALHDNAAALPVAEAAIKADSSIDLRMRLALATGFQRDHRDDLAVKMLVGDNAVLQAARQRLAAGRAIGMAIDGPSKGLAAALVPLASELLRDPDKALPISLVQIARYADPGNVPAQILLGLLLDGDKRTDEAVAVLGAVPGDNLLAPSAEQAEVAILAGAERYDEALRIAEPAAQRSGADSDTIRRYGDVLADMDRNEDAAAAYGRAIEVTKAEGDANGLLSLYLLRAASLEEIDRWPEAKAELRKALALQPENPILLNFLGYGSLERGENIPEAEAMIRKASALRPDDASITDSLGWALFKTGRTEEAIKTLTSAATADPAEAEIHEHLGDALYTAERRIEARFSWNAALVTAKDKDKGRIQAKLDYGLNSANAAP